MLTVLRSAAVLLAFVGTAAAAPPSLTPAEINDGWLMLFDGESTFGWTVQGEATVKDGVLIVGGAKPTTLTSVAHFLAPKVMTDFVSADAKPIPGGGIYLPQFRDINIPFAGVSALRGTTSGTGDRLRPAGPVQIDVPAGSVVHIRKLAVRPSGMWPLFDGKDLARWKRYTGDPKREKSKFEVTPAGELHLTDGPGDLQTTRTYADFLLQLECKTNGKGLNSGVFFRGLPGQYQQGYEAQIHNLFKDGDRTKPTDFGTGAIYRRIPARKVVPNDGEWFTMTVLANGPHLATWVNGYPTVNWTDDRKPAENARQGRYTKAGVISLQGHDPTTDLLFRNIRIVDMARR